MLLWLDLDCVMVHNRTNIHTPSIVYTTKLMMFEMGIHKQGIF